MKKAGATTPDEFAADLVPAAKKVSADTGDPVTWPAMWAG